MKMKVVDAIRRTSDEQIAKIIGAIVLQNTEGITVEEAIKIDYPNTLKELQREIEIDYKQTNADRIRTMTDEELADYIFGVSVHEKPCVLCSDDCGFCELTDEECKGETLKWLRSEVEE